MKLHRYNLEPKREVISRIMDLPAGSVVRINETGNDPDVSFFEIQEYAVHGTLSDFMANNRPLKPEFIRSFISEINSCLYDIHERNIIHRDIKPSNILIRSLDPVDLVPTDFGIASISEFSLHLTGVNRTILYSSPESVTGVISRATDYLGDGNNTS